MSDGLKDRVRQGSETGRAVRPGNGRRNGAAAPTAPAPAPPAPPPEPMPDPDEVPVVLALIRAMRDVIAVGKDGYHDAPGAKFNFRGIDAVLNAVGPAFRRHGIIVMPKLISKDFRDVTTSGGKPAHEVQTTVRYRFYGPKGDFVDAEVPGEAMDSADKGVSKAMSVAYRIALIQALTLPTDEPDPDSYHYERAVVTDPAEIARGELVAGMKERDLDAEAVLAAFYRRYQEDVRTSTDAGAIYAFTSELFADPDTVLAPPPKAEPQDPAPADASQDSNGTPGDPEYPTEGEASS